MGMRPGERFSVETRSGKKLNKAVIFLSGAALEAPKGKDMGHHSIVIACRDASDGDRIRKTLGEASLPVYCKSAPVLAQIETAPDAYVVATPLLLDENIVGLLTKMAILQPMYTAVYADQCDGALNILRFYGCGAFGVLGSGELDMLPALMSPDRAVVDNLVMPPFFIDDDVSNLKEPPLNSAQTLHVTFLGAQALMSFSNAALNIEASPLMSFACRAPQNAWACERLAKALSVGTGWGCQTRPAIAGGSVALCKNIAELSSLEPSGQHFVVCHGYISDEERAFLDRLPPGARLFVASNEGYLEQCPDSGASTFDPERLWDIFISALYRA